MKFVDLKEGDCVVFNLGHSEHKPRPESDREIMAEVILISDDVRRDHSLVAWVQYIGPSRQHTTYISATVQYRIATDKEVFMARLEGKL